MERITVTAYENPDLDGYACAFAYAEFLQKSGKNAVAAIFGKHDKETEFVVSRFKIKKVQDAEKIDNVTFILVDASAISGISDKINRDKVIEIIDHRKVHDANLFPHAHVQIELVGAAATLIAEKYHKNKIVMSRESAVLLYSAIVSNTINFQANVTTDRDRKIARWLQEKIDLPEDYIHNIFAYKTKSADLKWTLVDDLAEFQFGKYHVGVAQLEIMNAELFIDKNKEKIMKMLTQIKKKKSFQILFFTCIDIEKAFNIIIAEDQSQKVLEQALHIKFNDGIAKRKGILMRKEIVPLVKDVLLHL